ncbi:MAG: MFS transporter [Dehalococcoidales bacterium]|nr:MFS transporter [Dehalococcoidales bacterium]
MSADGQRGNVAAFIQRNLRWNFIALSCDYGFFGLGLTLASTYTVLAAFAERLGASNLLIGALPAVQTLGWGLPALLAANYTERQARKMPLVLSITLLERVPYLLIGLAALMLAESQPALALALTIVFVATMAFSGGVLMPAWMDVIAKVIPMHLRGRFFALGDVLSGLMGVGGAALVGYFLTNYAFPLSYALCFFAAAGAAGISFVFLASTREYAAPPTKPAIDLATYMRRLPGLLRTDRDFTNYMLARALSLGSTAAFAFYTVYGLVRLHAQEEQVAAFTLFLLLSEASSTVLLGWLADRFGHRTVLMLGAAAGIVGNPIAMLAWSPEVLYPVFALMGTARAATIVAHQSIILEFGGAEDRPTYVGLAGTLMAPVALGAPLLGGVLADNVGYEVVFATAAALAFLNLLCLATLVREPRRVQAQAGEKTGQLGASEPEV